ncbi:MAG: hypothetical protein JWO61_400 [Candidatus Saccharibacteria bacterium]|nr:hypothetical protein [Candidatus Saccharibacteria bacterium]
MNLNDMPYFLRKAEDIHNDRMESISLANMALQKKAAQHTLKIQHRTMIITMLAVIVAMFSSVVAIVIALNQPTPNVKVELRVDDKEALQQTTPTLSQQ